MDDDADALISDIGMPGEDGFDLIRRVRELHVPKPIEPAELAALVASLAGHAAGT